MMKDRLQGMAEEDLRIGMPMNLNFSSKKLTSNYSIDHLSSAT